MIYSIEMSKGAKIKIDEDDLKKIRDNIGAPLIQIKQGIINPSFLISITPTDEKDIIHKPRFQLDVEARTSRVVGYDEVKVLQDKMTKKDGNIQIGGV